MPFRLGMLGMWHVHAHGMVRRVAEHKDEFQLVGFYDTDPATARERARAWEPVLGAVPLYKSPDELLGQPLDGVLVEGRGYENLRLAQLALESGKPVLLEKPAGNDRSEYRKLVELARRKHLHVQMAYLFRYMAAVQELIRRVRAGALGRIYLFRGRLPKGLDEYTRLQDELKPYPGGVFFEMAGHLIDLMVTLLGKPKQVQSFLGHHRAGHKGTFVDNALAVFAYDHAWGIVESCALEVAKGTRRIEVYGDAGAAVIPHLGSGHLANPLTERLELYRPEQSAWQTLELPAAPLQIADLREFAACCRGRKTPDWTLDHDIVVQELLLQASGMGSDQ